MDFTIKIDLLSDAIFGNGQSVAGFIDADVQHDDWGFPYLGGKTFKGKMAEMAAALVVISQSNPALKDKADQLASARDRLFGTEGQYQTGKLFFSDCEMAEDVRRTFRYYMDQEHKIKPLEVLEALTYVDMQTSIDEETGIAKEGSLRNFRVMGRGVSLYCQVHTDHELDDNEKFLIGASCRMLKHLGMQETKGKGQVELSLNINQTNMTDLWIDSVMKGAKR